MNNFFLNFPLQTNFSGTIFQVFSSLCLKCESFALIIHRRDFVAESFEIERSEEISLKIKIKVQSSDSEFKKSIPAFFAFLRKKKF